jgi:type I restriction enzyme S subunit
MTEIGEIPEEWETSVLNNVVDIMDHKRIPLSEAQRMNKKGPYPYCGANGIIDYIDNFIFDDECVLLAEDGGTYEKFENKAYIMDGKYWVNNHAHVIKGKQGIAHNRFILYWLNFSDIRKYITGSTRTKLNLENLKKIPLPKIPLPEQQRIAEILSTADEAIQMVNDQITQTEHLKKGLMQTLLTKGIGHTKFKMTEIGEIPEEWPLRPFSEVLQIRKRKNEGKSEKIYTIPMELIPQNETYCGYRSLNKSEVVPPTYCECGDILLPKITPSVENGKQGIVPTMPSGNAFATSEVYALFTNGSLTNIYTFYLLKLSLFRKPLIDSMVGTTGRQRVPKDSLFNLSFPVPPIPEQQKISEILTTIDHKLELLRSKKTHLEELKKGMMEELLTGRVRVKV